MADTIDFEAYKYLDELCNGEIVHKIVIRGKEFKIRGLRNKAQRMISSKLISREIPKEDAKRIKQINAMGKYSMIPYEVLAIALLNNNIWFLLFPFIHKIYAWWLSYQLTQDDIQAAIPIIIQSLQLNGFFLTIMSLEASLDMLSKITKSQAGVLLASVQSEKKST